MQNFILTFCFLWNFPVSTVWTLNSSKQCVHDDGFNIYQDRNRIRHIRSVENTTNIPGGPLKLPIGTIFNAQDQQLRSSFRLACDLYNQNTDKKFELAWSTKTIDVANNFQLATALCTQMSSGVFLFYGMKDINSIDIVESYTRRFHMPYISPSLSSVVTRYGAPFQLHMKPSYTMAIVDMIRFYKWKSVHFLYDSDEGLQRLQEIYDSEKSKDSDLTIGFRRLNDVNHAHEELKHLDRFIKDHPEKAIVLDLTSQQAYKSLLRQIAEVGMNKHSYFYLLATLDFSKLDFQRFLHGGVNLTGFDLVSEDNDEIRKFNKHWMSAKKSEYAGAGTPLTSESAMAVDALRLIVDTFTRMLAHNQLVFQPNFRRGKVYNSNYSKEGIPCNRLQYNDPPPIPWMHGENITHFLKQAEFDGLTGHISFNITGFRRNYALNVSTVGQDHGPVRIGQWTPEHGYRTPDEEPPDTRPAIQTKIKRITTILSQPFLMLKEKKDGIPFVGNDRYKGYALDIANELASRLKFNFTMTEVADNAYGIKVNGTWNGMIGELVRGDADLAIAPLTITFDREKDVDFTKPFMNIGISIMIKKPDIEKPGVFSFMQPLELGIWICILVAYAAVSVGLFLVSRCSPYEWKKVAALKGEYENDFSILNSFWFSTGALMLQGSDTCPRSISGRIIGTVWWFFVLIIISTYTANLAAFLTVERMVAPIESADDLAKQTEIKYGTISSGTTRKFFETSKVPIYQQMWHFMSTQPSVMVGDMSTGIERVRNSKGKYAFLLESSGNEYINSREPCDTMRVGRNLNSKGFGIATPENYYLRDNINLAVLTIKENGFLHKLQQKWWQDKSQCAQDSGKGSSGKKSLSLSNVAGVFYILIGGLVSAVILGAIEFGMKRLRLVPKPAYMKGTETATSLIDTPSERENGDVNEYAAPPPHYPADFSQDKSVRTFTYGTPQLIGFEALDDRNTHTDV
ncbi:glutamate receptor 2-like [Pecten maximus]|uniref:glutamate receptor 2-like n=1 Tax=Pecten maximus TaxID=6579 RepID=UPI0014586FC5|nr:glutamate receptor 2-like [Pecten maximus]